MRKLLFIIIALLCLVSCKETLKVPELKVAVSPDLFPFTFTERDTLKGLEIELLKLIEKRFRVPVNITTFRFTQLLENFHNGDFDIAVGGITITEGRSELFDFSVPYYSATQTVLSRKNPPIPVDSLAGIARHRIGVVSNSTSLLFLENSLMRDRMLSPNNVRRFSNQNSLISALTAGEVNLILLENSIAKLVAQKHDLQIVYTHYIKEYYGLAFKKDSPLQVQIDRALDRILNTEEWIEIMSNFLL